MNVKVNVCWWKMEDRRWEMGEFKDPADREERMVKLFRPYRAGRFLALFPGLTPFALLFRPVGVGRISLSLGLS